MNISPGTAEQPLQEDAELMRSFCEGEMSAFDLLYERHNGPLVNRLLTVCGDVHLAEDAAQETWHAVVACRSSYNPPLNSSFSGWLYAIGYRKAISAWRHARRENVSFPTESEETAIPPVVDCQEPISELIRSEDAERLCHAIRQLSQNFRTTVLLYYFEEYDAPAIADIMQIAEATVYSRLHAARKQLLGRLREQSP